MNKILSIKHIMGFIALSMFLLVLSVPAAAKIIDDEILLPIDRCTTGQKQYQASGCSYQTKTCCSTGSWSDWDTPCPSCTSSQCWNGISCVNKPTETSVSCKKSPYNGKSGTLSLSYICRSGTGWSTNVSGTCTCYAGYTWDGIEMTCKAGCAPPACNYDSFVNYNKCQCCMKSCLTGGGCDCVEEFAGNTCCRFKLSGRTYTVRLGYGYSSCASLAAAVGGTNVESEFACSII